MEVRHRDIKGFTGGDGKRTITRIYKFGNSALLFEFWEGRPVLMHHRSSCCEEVYLEDIVGDLNDLLHVPLKVADERIKTIDEDADLDGDMDVDRWTFYELATLKGAVTLRWVGTSNGYYSTEVHLDWADESFKDVLGYLREYSNGLIEIFE